MAPQLICCFTLRKTCPYSELSWSAFLQHFPEISLQSISRSISRSISPKYLSVFSPNVGKCGKNADHKNSEYGHFFTQCYCHIFIHIESKWLLKRNLATILLLKSKLSGNFQRFNAIDWSIEMLKISWISTKFN